MEVQKSGGVNVLVGKFNEILQDAIGAPLRYVANWGRLYSLWPVHLETACWSVEVGAAAGSRFDMEHFGVLEGFGSPVGLTDLLAQSVQQGVERIRENILSLRLDK